MGLRICADGFAEMRIDASAHSPASGPTANACQACRTLVDYPWGFELDHITPLHQGGADDEQNSQVLCVRCHREKTRREMGHREVRAIGIDGWPESGGAFDGAKA